MSDQGVQLDADAVMRSFRQQIAQAAANHAQEIAERDAFIQQLQTQLSQANDQIAALNQTRVEAQDSEVA